MTGTILVPVAVELRIGLSAPMTYPINDAFTLRFTTNNALNIATCVADMPSHW